MTEQAPARPALANLGWHDHLAFIFETPAEQFPVVAQFIRIGLERGERCLYIASENPPEQMPVALRESSKISLETRFRKENGFLPTELSGALSAEGVDAGQATQAGALVVLNPQESYLRQGHFEPADMLAFWDEAIAAAQAAGFAGVRAAVEMTWVLGSGEDTRQVMKYEAWLNPYLEGRKALALCQYNRQRFPPETILDVIRTHPIVIYGGRVCENPYYLPPQEYLSSRSAEREAQRLLTNLSALQEARMQVEDSERYLQTIFDNTRDAILLVDDSGRYTDANAAACDLLGYSREELLQLGITDVAVPEALESLPATRARFLAGETRSGEYTLLRKDGSRREIEFRAVNNILPGKHLSAMRDITERKKREQALRRSEERFARIFRSSPLGIGIGPAIAGRIEDVNERYAEFFGYRPEEMRGRTVGELGLWERPAERQAVIEQLQSTGSVRNVEVAFRTKSGERRYGLLSMELLDIQGEPTSIAMVADITERKRLEARQMQSARRLEALAELSGALVGVGTGYRTALSRIASRTAQAIGDCCVVTLASEGSDIPEPVAFAHRDPQAAKIMEQVLTENPRQTRAPAAGRVARTGEVLFLPEVEQAQMRAALDPVYLRYFDAVGIDSLLIAPLLVNGQVIGTIGLTRDRGGVPYSEEDLSYLQTLADRAALAISNARLYDSVRAGRERLRALSRRLVDAQETERRSIARELHDEVGQLLTGLQLTLAMAGRLAAGEAAANIAEALTLTREVTARVRDLSLTLRPSILDDLGLLPALIWHCDRYTTQTRVAVDLQHTGVEGRRFPSGAETAAYRIVQEALTNAARHANTGAVAVRVWADKQLLGVQVQDNGAGFDALAALAASNTSGLAGMHERAELLGGRFSIEAAPGQGTRVTAELGLAGPLERRGDPDKPARSPPGDDDLDAFADQSSPE